MRGLSQDSLAFFFVRVVHRAVVGTGSRESVSPSAQLGSRLRDAGEGWVCPSRTRPQRPYFLPLAFASSRFCHRPTALQAGTKHPTHRPFFVCIIRETCAHVQVCTCICGCDCTCVSLCVEVRGQHWTSFLIALHLPF